MPSREADPYIRRIARAALRAIVERPNSSACTSSRSERSRAATKKEFIYNLNDRPNLGPYPGQCAQHRSGEQLAAVRRLAKNCWYGAARKDSRRSWPWAGWVRSGQNRPRFWHGSDRLESKHDPGGSPDRRCSPRLQGWDLRAGRHSDDPSGVERPHTQSGGRGGACANEADGSLDQYLAGADRG